MNFSSFPQWSALRPRIRRAAAARRPSLRADEAGVAYVELAIVVLPFLLTVIFAVFECATLLRLKQGVTFIAKEAASYAFRECSPYEDLLSAQECTVIVQTRMQGLGRLAVDSQEVDLIVSVHGWEGGAVQTLTVAPPAAPPDNVNTQHGFRSKVIAQMNTDAALSSMVQEHDRVAIAEVNAIYRPIFPTLAFLDFTRFDLYEIAIY